MRLQGYDAARARALGLWRAKGGAAVLLSAGCLWIFFFWVAAKLSAWSGLGREWADWRWAVSCAGSSSELFFAIVLPVLACADDMVDGRYYSMSGEYGEMPPRPSSSGNPVKAGLWVSAVVLALNMARFAAPWWDSVPWPVAMMAGWWCVLVDAVACVAIVGLWLGSLCVGCYEIFRLSVNLEGSEWRASERECVSRSCRPFRAARSAGPKRL